MSYISHFPPCLYSLIIFFNIKMWWNILNYIFLIRGRRYHIYFRWYLQILLGPIFYQDIYQKKQNAEKISPFDAFLAICRPKTQNLLFCLQCNVNKNKDSFFWSILTFSWIKKQFPTTFVPKLFSFKPSLRILIPHIYIYTLSKYVMRP